MGRPRIPIVDRLMRYSQVGPAQCRTWTGSVTSAGYGKIGIYEHGADRPHTHHSVHRIAYEEFIGPIPEGLTIDHLCRNRLCINPLHLEAVTPRENTLRGNTVSGINARKTHCSHGHELAGENLRVLKSGPRAGKRVCRTCAGEIQSGYYARKAG